MFLRALAVLAFALILFSLAETGNAQDIWYVDDDGSAGAGGTSWADALAGLQAALVLAGAGDEIWVAAGTYRPAEMGGDRSATFQLRSGVGVYGGFAGHEVMRASRAGLTSDTILSGDLDGNDAIGTPPDGLLSDPTRSENSFNVVTGSGVDATAVLDGFTICSGQATGTPSGVLCGGGLLNNGGSPTITSCRFLYNAAQDIGGGMCNLLSSHPPVTHCLFRANAAGGAGGGMANREGSNPSLSFCAFEDNEAVNPFSVGGGMNNFIDCSPTITDCRFLGNHAAGVGGGLDCSQLCDPVILRCDFVGNSAGSFGGGLNNFDRCNPTLTECSFVNNATAGGGAGMSNQLLCSPIVARCSFQSNSAANGGGGMRSCDRSSPQVNDCWFVDNTAIYGAGMSNSLNSDAVVSGCHFIENHATGPDPANPGLLDCLPTDPLDPVEGAGGGMWNYDGSSPIVLHCKFRQNTAAVGAGMRNRLASSPSVSYCTFENNLASLFGGGLNSTVLCHPLVDHCVFLSNAATNGGGGMNLFANSDATVTDSQFIDNRARFGGGLANGEQSMIRLSRCEFLENIAEKGSGISNGGLSDLRAVSCLFRDNLATGIGIDLGGGAALRNENLSFAMLTGCTFHENVAAGAPGGAMINRSSGSVANSCVFWGNHPDQVFDDAASTTSVSYSDVQGSWPGLGNVDVDPQFIDPVRANLRLAASSPLIDAGDPALMLVDTDLDSNPRVLDGLLDGTVRIDMGCYEFRTVRRFVEGRPSAGR
jgi:hypothetical protein